MDKDIIKDIVNALSADKERKFYVYRLVDPRTLQTFYVGKGCGDRIFQHVEIVKNKKRGTTIILDDEDALSLKETHISDIIASGLDVIYVIHRWGLTEGEAFEVESALIDAYPGLDNIQNGHDFERGIIRVEDYYKKVKISEYEEPAENYVIIKTTQRAIDARGNIYEATRLSWRADINKANSYRYVLAVVYGIVREVFEVDKWYKLSSGRIAFEGHPSHGPITYVKGQRIPAIYRTKGASNPFLYKK